MRIAWTGPVGDGGGVAAMGAITLRELVRQGVEVDLYLVRHAGQPPAIESLPGLRIIEQRSGWRWGRWYSSTKPRALFSGLAMRIACTLALNLRLLAAHRRRPYDAVYQLSTTELFVLGRAGRLAPPIVVHPCTHTAGELRWHRAEQAYALAVERRPIHLAMRAMLMLRSRLQPHELARAACVIGMSERFNDHLRDDYGVPGAALRVLRSPIDLERFSPGESSTDSGVRNVLFISRISARKGVQDIVALSHRLSDLAPAVRLLVIGGPTLWSDYTGHLRELNPAVAQWIGGMRSDELPALLRSAAMLLVPSYYEPGSIVTAEALACGLPVVLSDEIGNGEVVDGPHVRTHRPGDVDGLEAAVRSLLAALDEDEPAIRAAARANAERAFAPGPIAEQLTGMIADVAHPPAPSAPVKEAIKARVLPGGAAPRTVRAGIARGVRMRIDFASQLRLYLGLYEVELDRHLRRILAPGVASFDVGAQHGYDSLAIAKRTRAPVAAFECDRTCLDGMRESFALNPGLAPLIVPVEATVGRGSADLGLDEWAYNEGFVPDFIKIDIEGAELDALRSAERILRERHPALIVEVHSEDLEREAGGLLLNSGYRPLVVSQRRLLPDHRPAVHNRWLVALGSGPGHIDRG